MKHAAIWVGVAVFVCSRNLSADLTGFETHGIDISGTFFRYHTSNGRGDESAGTKTRASDRRIWTGKMTAGKNTPGYGSLFMTSVNSKFTSDIAGTSRNSTNRHQHAVNGLADQWFGQFVWGNAFRTGPQWDILNSLRYDGWSDTHSVPEPSFFKLFAISLLWVPFNRWKRGGVGRQKRR